MRSIGLDVGSRTIKLALVEDGEIVFTRLHETTFDPLNVCRNLLSGVHYDAIIATGYGRHLLQHTLSCRVISEIKAFALGAHHCFPDVRTVIDVGGQDIKVIAVDSQGRAGKFEMNDKCAAGTGRFLEIMAMAMGYTMEEFSSQSCSAPPSEQINSMCTVFAESEVVSLLARGADRSAVACGVYQAIVKRLQSMIQRVPSQPDYVFAGGGALNQSLTSLLEQFLGMPLHRSPQPQLIGALGCALHAGRTAETTEIIEPQRSPRPQR